MNHETIHYHGSPIWGAKGEVNRVAITGAGAFISYARPDQIKAAFKYADSVAIDNGAFSAWKRGLQLDWTEFYQWLMGYYFNEKLRFFIIPDKIDGTEEDNDRLINSVPSMFKDKACPVWHLHESLEKLNRLCGNFDRVAFGSSGEFATIRTKSWHSRMKQAFKLIEE
jgi:hypothetical protein